jgi:hypothetical protein
MTKNVTAAIQALVNELNTNETLATNWNHTFTFNIIQAHSDNNTKLSPDHIDSLIDGIKRAFCDLITQADDPKSWVYNDKSKILDAKRALRKVKKQIRKA